MNAAAARIVPLLRESVGDLLCRRNSSRRLVEKAGDHFAVSLILAVTAFLLRLGVLGFICMIARARLLLIDLEILRGA